MKKPIATNIIIPTLSSNNLPEVYKKLLYVSADVMKEMSKQFNEIHDNSGKKYPDTPETVCEVYDIKQSGTYADIVEDYRANLPTMTCEQVIFFIQHNERIINRTAVYDGATMNHSTFFLIDSGEQLRFIRAYLHYIGGLGVDLVSIKKETILNKGMPFQFVVPTKTPAPI